MNNFAHFKYINRGILVFLPIFLWGCAEDTVVLRLGVASSNAALFEEVKTLFEQEEGKTLEITYAASGTLYNQITNGAPYDLFFSADTFYNHLLYESGWLEREPAIYAKGGLALYVHDINGMEDINTLLKKAEVIGLAKPEIAPIGDLGLKYMEDKNLFPDLLDKLVYAQSVSQVNQYIYSGVIDVAFTSISSCIAGGWDKKCIALGEHYQVPQSFGVIKGSSVKKRELKEFFQFFESSKAQAIVNKFGYF